MNPIENLKTFPSKSYTNVTGRERILFVDPKNSKRGTTPPVNYIDLQTLTNLVNSGSIQFENIDYTTLYNKVVNGELVPGQWYRLTDYQSVNFLNGYRTAENNPSSAPNFDPREIYQGDEEILLLQAISEYDIAPIGYSETYPGDIVQYEPFTNTIGLPLNIYNGNTLPDSSTVSGFDLQWDGTNVYFELPTGYPALFGHEFYIYASFDGASYNLSQYHNPLLPGTSTAQYIFSSFSTKIKVENNGTKVILLDLTQADYLDYLSNSLYVESAYAIDDAYGWVTKRIDTVRNITAPFDFRGRKYRRYECEVFGNITQISYSASGNTASDGVFMITSSSYTTDSVQGAQASFTVTVVGGAVVSVEIYNPGMLYATAETFLIDGTQIGGTSGVDDVTITIDNIYSSIDYWGLEYIFNGATSTGNYKDFKCFDNIGLALNIEWDDLGGADVTSRRGNNDNVVIFNSIINTKIATSCYNNTLDNSTYNCILNEFYNNTIENGFQNNIINVAFNRNVIGKFFNYNSIKDNFSSNMIMDYFGYNSIQSEFSGNLIAESFSNNVIGNYFDGNVIGNNFSYNHILTNFRSNNIKEGFGFGGSSSQGNIIGNYFSYNNIGEYFYNNTIADGFYGNTIGDYFQLNAVKTALSSTNFVSSGATHVYGYYNCDIFRRNDNTLQLSYIDNTNTVQYTVTTA